MSDRDQMLVNRYQAKRKSAVSLFIHYMTVTWEEAGISIDGDNVSEWENLIDSIIDAAVAKVRMLDETK